MSINSIELSIDECVDLMPYAGWQTVQSKQAHNQVGHQESWIHN